MIIRFKKFYVVLLVITIFTFTLFTIMSKILEENSIREVFIKNNTKDTVVSNLEIKKLLENNRISIRVLDYLEDSDVLYICNKYVDSLYGRDSFKESDIEKVVKDVFYRYDGSSKENTSYMVSKDIYNYLFTYKYDGLVSTLNTISMFRWLLLVALLIIVIMFIVESKFNILYIGISFIISSFLLYLIIYYEVMIKVYPSYLQEYIKDMLSYGCIILFIISIIVICIYIVIYIRHFLRNVRIQRFYN